MWLLENEEIFEGRRLWLRPGKTYLFGRTAAEPGQLAVSHNTVSRKHLTITVDAVQQGHVHHVASRSRLTVEDLATKIGTVVNGQKIKGSKYVVDGPEVELTMGKCPSVFRLAWFPVVLTFSFTNKELQAEPLTALGERFENLDIKLSTEYHLDQTTHVVSKKRNTAKGLQALINGKYVVTETFLDAVVQATQPAAGDADMCPLEMDFSQNWPDPMQHLPPRGGEPVQHPNEIYAPDLGRKDVFEGYTFIFYDKTQYNNLLAPITNGGGKAMLRPINAGEERVEDFVRYVKEVAGEKGLGSFDDGSEGKGVVLVRYLPGKGDLVSWYTEFITGVSLRLDHRPIEQNEFLEAILTKDASKLRRPLEVEPTQTRNDLMTHDIARSDPESRPGSNGAVSSVSQVNQDEDREEQHAAWRGAKRRPIKRRFAGFDDDEDVDMDEPPPPKAPQRDHAAPEEDDGGLFVSQEPVASQTQHADGSASSTRKRGASALPEDDLMEGMAPAVARFKRQRIAHAGVFASPEPERTTSEPSAAARNESKKNKKAAAAKEIDVLAMAARHREEEDARAKAEREDLAQLPEDVDLAEIRRLNIVEEMEVRAPPRAPRTREQDVADGRWNPRWNGVKNFKKFRPRGEHPGRQPARVIVPLTQVRNKEFGVGDNYWLEDDGGGGGAAASSNSRDRPAAPHRPVDAQDDTPAEIQTPPLAPPRLQQSSARRNRSTGFVVSDSSDDEQVQGEEQASGGTSAAASQPSRQQTRAGREKRPAPEPAPEPPRGKRARAAPRRTAMTDSDESDDELKFKFGRRR